MIGKHSEFDIFTLPGEIVFIVYFLHFRSHSFIVDLNLFMYIKPHYGVRKHLIWGVWWLFPLFTFVYIDCSLFQSVAFKKSYKSIRNYQHVLVLFQVKNCGLFKLYTFVIFLSRHCQFSEIIYYIFFFIEMHFRHFISEIFPH